MSDAETKPTGGESLRDRILGKLAGIMATNAAAEEPDSVPNVWMSNAPVAGRPASESAAGWRPGAVYGSNDDVYKTINALAGDVHALTPGSPYLQHAKNLVAAGVLDKRYATNYNSVMGATATALEVFKASNRGMPFDEWLAARAAAGKKLLDDSSSGGGGGGSRAFTNVSVDLTNETDARLIVDNALNQYLGRDASDKEREKFWKQLNAQQRKNPNITSGVSGPGGTSSVSRGGFNEATFAEDFAKSRNDYAETQASTTVLGWMKESLMKDQTEGLM